MTSVAERIEPPELFEFFVEQRAAMGLTIVPLDASSGSAVMSTLRRGGLVGLLSDRDLAGNGIEVEFFGETTTMPAGPGHPGPPHRSATGHRGRLQRPRSGSLAPSCEPPLDTTRHGSLREDVTRLTQGIATRFEGLIRRAPEQWHVFQPLWLVRPRPGRRRDQVREPARLPGTPSSRGSGRRWS